MEQSIHELKQLSQALSYAVAYGHTEEETADFWEKKADEAYKEIENKQSLIADFSNNGILLTNELDKYKHLHYTETTRADLLQEEVERLRKENESYKELENESKNDWISVDNFLPLDRESVIIFWIHEGKKRITSGSYNHEGKYWSHGNATQMKVTHWRKLPQPPINH